MSTFPYFWTALLLLFFLGYVLHWFPTTGASSATSVPGWNGEYIGDVLRHAILPAVTILVTSLGGWIIGMRNAMINTLGDDYVTFAEANGLRGRTVAVRTPHGTRSCRT